jgi:HD-GYP domain-containing protein (c-di-GMP phosphodiesterase class II)
LSGSDISGEREGSERPESLEELRDAYEDQLLLVGIGRSLIEEKDPNRLLGLILDACRRITGADAGTIFLCEENDKGPVLRFKHSHSASGDTAYEEYTMPRDERSIAGYVSITGRGLNIPDAYFLDPDLPYRFNPGYDRSTGYRTRSMLVVPMRDHAGAVIGVIQLINAKEHAGSAGSEGPVDSREAEGVLLRSPEDFETKVFPFKARYVELLEAVANQAAIALENSRMIKVIEEQFEAFVRASISAIESRDPATSGHSARVSRLAVALMAAVDSDKEGIYAPCSFGPSELREIEYAGLLHDFGKVYIDERIFTKAKKLFERDYDCLVLRLKFLYRSLELRFARREFDAIRSGRPEEANAIDAESVQALRSLMETLYLIDILNEPRETEVDPKEELDRLIASAPPPELLADLDGSPLPLVTEDERANLSIRRGSLNDKERVIIQSHVQYTEAFVSRIPWPTGLGGIPEYCAKHHEMLDGSGYPRGLTGDRIPLQARMLAVADIYDALAARDRPYKKALPPDAVRRILEDEAGRGRLDAELVRIFYRDECWRAGENGADGQG